MDTLTSRDDEKRLLQAREQGRMEEQNLQRERELATEQGRKQGLDEERSRENIRAQCTGKRTGECQCCTGECKCSPGK